MKPSLGAISFLLLAVSAFGARSARIRHEVTDSDHHEVGAFIGGATESSDLRGAAKKIRSGLPQAAFSDSTSFETEDGCRRVCEEDVLDNDVCIGTPSNPVPNGEVWMFRDDWSNYGCCAFGIGACKECCPPSEEDELAFVNADEAELARELFDEMETDINNFEHFDSATNVDDPWKDLSGVCLTLSSFTIIQEGSVPLSPIMKGIVDLGRRANGNGRNRNGFFYTDENVYHETSQLSFLGGGSMTYRVLGYDYSGQSPESRQGTKRVVELPWQLAPHGEAIYTELERNPQEYGQEDKLAYYLKSSYIGEVLVKMSCCTEEELVEYEEVSESPLHYFLADPSPPMEFTSTPQQCEQMEPAHVKYAQP